MFCLSNKCLVNFLICEPGIRDMFSPECCDSTEIQSMCHFHGWHLRVNMALSIRFFRAKVFQQGWVHEQGICEAPGRRQNGIVAHTVNSCPFCKETFLSWRQAFRNALCLSHGVLSSFRNLSEPLERHTDPPPLLASRLWRTLHNRSHDKTSDAHEHEHAYSHRQPLGCMVLALSSVVERFWRTCEHTEENHVCRACNVHNSCTAPQGKRNVYARR